MEVLKEQRLVGAQAVQLVVGHKLERMAAVVRIEEGLGPEHSLEVPAAADRMLGEG